MSSVKSGKPGKGCEQGSSPGFSASVAGEAGYRVTAGMTRTPIIQGASSVQPLGQQRAVEKSGQNRVSEATCSQKRQF
jgi:hypothetical protein